MTTLLILGGTGAVGRQLVEQALADPAVTAVVAPSRRPLPQHAKLTNPIVDYAQLPREAEWWRADAALCALGTTLRQAGSQDAFRKVDHDYVVAAAACAQHWGTGTFVLNSALGASASSRSFYLRVKGETERNLEQVGFASLTLVRPSLLDAGKRPDWRPGETAGLWFAHRLAPVIPARYRAVPTAAVAAVMLQAACVATPGVQVIESDQIH